MIEYRLQEQIRLTLLLLPASDSNITTEGGKGIFSDKAAIISLLEFRIITPILTSFELSKTVPSKLVLKESEGGGDHFFLPLLVLSFWLVGWLRWNRCRYAEAKSAILSRGMGLSCKRDLFQWVLMNQAITTNTSSSWELSRIWQTSKYSCSFLEETS